MSSLATFRAMARLEIPEINSTDAVSDADFLTIANQACREFLRRIKDYVVVTSFNAIAGQAAYDFQTYIPTYGRLHRDGLSWSNSAGVWRILQPTTRAVLSEEFPTWQSTSSGTPLRYFVEGNGVTVNPPPTTAGANLFRLTHYPRSVDVTTPDTHYLFTDSATVELVELVNYEDVLYDYLRGKVLKMLNKPAESQAAFTLFYNRCLEASGELNSRPDLMRDYSPRGAGRFYQQARANVYDRS